MIAGLTVGAGVTYFIGRRAWVDASATAQAEWHHRAAELLADLAAARGERTTIADEHAKLTAQIAAHEAHRHERAAAVDALVSRVGEQLSNTATENMRNGLRWAAGVAKTHVDRLQDIFARENADRDQAVEHMLRPVRDGMELLRTLTDRVERDRANTMGTLQEQLRILADGHLRLCDETSALTRALRTPQVRGRWGEMALERLVEASGMLRNVDFVIQPTLTTDDGNARPDMLISLPGAGHKIVVDSKVPLDAYLKATDAATEAERATWMDSHVVQVRKHVDQLSKKNYGAMHPDAMPIVLMFIPAEALYAEAVGRDATLVAYALERQVMLVTPSTLMLALRIAAFFWQQDKLSETAIQVRDLGAQLYARIGTMADHFDKLRRSLTATVKAFNAASASLDSRVLSTSRKLHRLNNLEGSAIEALQPVDDVARSLNAPELSDTHAVPDVGLDAPNESHSVDLAA